MAHGANKSYCRRNQKYYQKHHTYTPFFSVITKPAQQIYLFPIMWLQRYLTDDFLYLQMRVSQSRNNLLTEEKRFYNIFRCRSPASLYKLHHSIPSSSPSLDVLPPAKQDRHVDLRICAYDFLDQIMLNDFGMVEQQGFVRQIMYNHE